MSLVLAQQLQTTEKLKTYVEILLTEQQLQPAFINHPELLQQLVLRLSDDDKARAQANYIMLKLSNYRLNDHDILRLS